METNKPINQIILCYLEGDITPEELTELDLWLQEDKDHKSYFEEIQTIWLATETKLQLTNQAIDKEWVKLEKRNFPKQRLHPHWKQVIWAAAIFILGILFSWTASNFFGSGFRGETQGCVVTTPLGAKSNVTLPDGTRVILNAGSTLKYPGTFGQNTREVTLEGEAYFEVTKNKSKQFQVHTSDITVKAYGTKFNVKSYGEDKTIETTLIEGSVGVVKNKDSGHKHEELLLKPQEQLVFYKTSSLVNKLTNDPDKALEQEEDKTGKQEMQARPREQTTEKIMISKGIDPLLFTSWTEDRLILKSEPMQKMAISIERKYNIKIHFEDADIKDFRFTGTIENETLENLLAAISIASPVEYTVKDRDIWLRKKIVHAKSHSTQN